LRGRLIRRIAAWDARAAHDFADACVVAVRDAAADALSRAGARENAEVLLGLSHHGGFAASAGAATGCALAFLDDCVVLASGGRPEGEADLSFSQPVQGFHLDPCAIGGDSLEVFSYVMWAIEGALRLI
jgi:hypothetical protein